MNCEARRMKGQGKEEDDGKGSKVKEMKGEGREMKVEE